MQVYLDKLKKDGYCVIPNIFSSDKCDYYISKIWDWLEGLKTGIKRNNPKTWKSKNWPCTIRGIIQHHRVGHAQFIWDIRCEPNIINIFKEIWGTDKLLVSFDGMCVMKSPELMGKASRLETSWFHTDQSPLKEGLHCVQGFINLEEAGEEDGCLKVYKKSHLYHHALFKHFGNQDHKDDWYKLNDDEIKWLDSKNLEPIKVTAGKGSFVLWDSRTFHCNTPPENSREIVRNRYVVYVCMTPANLANDKDIIKKQKAFKSMRTCSHWPHKIKMFSLNPRTYGTELPNYKLQTKLPKLSKRGKQLAGLIPYEDNDKGIKKDNKKIKII